MVRASSTIAGRSPAGSRCLAVKDHGDGRKLLDSVKDSLGAIMELVEFSRHAMSEYIQIQKMTSMEQLADGLAHDINSCLTILGGEVHQLLKYGQEEKVRIRAERIQMVLDDLEGLVKHLSLLGKDDCISELVPRDLSIEVKKVMDTTASAMPSNVHLHVSTCAPPLPVRLGQGDVRRILGNLVSNALEAMPDGGDLLVNTLLREVDGEYCRKHGNARRGIFAVLRVTDYGKGMDQETMDRIFDPLFTTKSKKDHPGRHGWGLAIVYAMIRRRGGWIDVSSRPGEYTTFEVFLPLVRPE